MDFSSLSFPPPAPPPQTLLQAAERYRELAQFWRNKYLQEVLGRSRHQSFLSAGLVTLREHVERLEQHFNSLRGSDSDFLQEVPEQPEREQEGEQDGSLAGSGK